MFVAGLKAVLSVCLCLVAGLKVVVARLKVVPTDSPVVRSKVVLSVSLCLVAGLKVVPAHSAASQVASPAGKVR